MKPSLRCLILSCLGLLLFPSSFAFAQQFGNIVGEVHASRSDFPGRVLIELQLHGSPITSQYTDEQGKFAFYTLADNAYHLVIRDERFYPVDERVMLDLSVTSTKFVQLTLTPRQATQKQVPGPDRGKGSNPYIVDTEEYRRHFAKKAVKEFDKGVEADANGKRDDAIRHYEKALNIAPDFYPAHNNLGSDYLSKSDFDSAKAQFEQAKKLNQSDPEAHLNLGNLYLMMERYSDALANVQEGIRRDPNSALANFLLGSIYERMQRLPEAEHALRAALSINPTMSRVHLELVNLYLEQKAKPKAITELKAFLDGAPNDPLAPKAKQVLRKLQSTP